MGKTTLIYKLTILFLLGLCTHFSGFSQTPPPPMPIPQVADSLATVVSDSIPDLPYEFDNTQSGNLMLNTPSEIEVTYDPILKRYIIREKIGDYYISQPKYMTTDEYVQYRLKEDMLAHYKEKLKAIGGKTAGSEEAQRDLLPTYYVNSDFFSTIFGGNTIDVNPQGSIQIKLGILHQNIENPQISERNRKSTTFDFGQQITASINAKIGTRLAVTANYDTQSTFDFQNQIKLEYTPSEDDIIQKIEVGNVSMPIKNSLVTGAQNLFGFKTELQFGKTRVTGVFAEQKSQTRTVAAEGGTTINEFELKATDYDANRHFFLAHSFRDNYDTALQSLPLISSEINIVKMEVWVTNRQASTVDFRSIVALADLAENDLSNIGGGNVNPLGVTQDPSNQANDLVNLMTENGPIREIATVNIALAPYLVAQGRDYSVLQNARKLQPNEYEYHPQLGYISLNRRLGESDVLAVAYEYTVSGSNQVYKVGELTSDGVVAPKNLIVKLLRSEIIITTDPVWELMMKNIYALGAYQMYKEGFRFELLYRDDETGVPINVLQNAVSPGIDDRTLLNLFKIDRLDQNNVYLPEGDGYFDYVEGQTVNSLNGYVIFPTVQPFGESLDADLTDPADDIYLFNELYENTQSEAKNNYQNKDKYFLKGYTKSEGSSGIALGAYNVPQGSVTVTTGGRELVEGVDYVVDYQIGRVQIINPSLEASNAPIEVSVENNSVFNLQAKRFLGVDVEHFFSDKFVAGATILNLREKPLTQKALIGSEPINNTIFGFRADYGTDVKKFTKWINKLPNIDTDAISNFSVRGDIAYLLPGEPKKINVDGEATSYIDDFEGAQIPLELKSPQQWYIASTPQGQTSLDLGGDDNDLDYGKKRSKIAWYIIDQLFYGGSSLKPSNIDDAELSRTEVRAVRYEELFPEEDRDITQASIIRTLDLSFYPSNRGPNNYDTNNVGSDGSFTDPQARWGGITRPLTVTNFEQANIEYIQFWMQDPYPHYSITNEEGLPVGVDPNNPINQVGDLYFNLGNISEDVLKDGRKLYENGLPEDGGTENTDPTIWGKVPTGQSLLYTFGIDDASRLNQDIGLDGLNDEDEATRFGTSFGPDASSDNYHFFRGSDYDADDASILTRYQAFNNTQGNSPTASLSTESYPTSATNNPDVEDIDKDQTMSTVESYYQYRVSLNANRLQVGDNFIVDDKITTVLLDDGSTKEFRWLQFRIPITSPEEVINNIQGFNSIRFMRMFMTNFKIPVVLRFAELQLVRGEWRRYTKVIDESGNPTPPDLDPGELEDFTVGVVNIDENASRTPIPYVVPPGIERERLQGSTRIQFQNEQSISVKVENLLPGDTRAVYKNVSMDLRMYNKLKMFVHIESLSKQSVNDDDFHAILRLGSDLNENYYEIEVPLKVTAFGAVSADDIWPNDLNVLLDNLGKLKLLRFSAGDSPSDIYPAYGAPPPIEGLDGYEIRVLGNPNLGNVRTIMLGVKNNSTTSNGAELWFNELRTSEFDNEGGWAAVVSADVNFADFANVSVTGRMETIGFGAIEQNLQARSQENSKLYDIVSNVNLGQLLPKDWGVKVPVNYSRSEEFHNPKYDEQYQDVLFKDAVNINPNSNESTDHTERTSFSVINVRKDRTDGNKKQHFYDVENLSASYAFNETKHQNYNIKNFTDQNVRASANYNYAFPQKSIEPFQNWGFLTKNKYLQFIRDFNFSYLPSNIAVNTNIIRSYNEQTSRSLVENLPPLPTLKQRNFMFDWDYNIAYNLTKSLQFNFRALNNYVYDDFDVNENISLYDNFFTVGRPEQYHQTLNVTYQIPIDKLPFLDFIHSDYAFSADYDWQSASLSYVDRIGNTIQNANTQNLSIDADFERLYRSSGLTKLFTKRIVPGKVVKTGEKDEEGNAIKKQLPAVTKKGSKIGKSIVDVLLLVKKARATYSERSGILLGGFIPRTGVLGLDNYSGGSAPSFGFVFGSQIDIRNRALESGWLVSRNINYQDGSPDDLYYNRIYSQTHFNKFDIFVNVSPVRDLDIEISATKTYTKSVIQQIDVVNDLATDQTRFEDNPIAEVGNFSMSFNMIRTSFDGDSDKLFQEFKDNRSVISQRFADDSGAPISGFGVNSQEIMLPAFVATYSGKDANSVNENAFRDVPLPNWTLTYRGLMRVKWFKKNFQSFTISHGYRSLYSINNYTNNLLYDANDPYGSTDIAGNYYNENLFSAVNVIEEFSPLAKVDFKMRNSLSLRAEVRKDRMLNLNFNNNTLTEIEGTEYVVGAGYRIRNVKFKFKFNEKNQSVNGDLNIRADLGIRNNITLIRDIDEDNDQVTGGQNLFSLKLLADYALSRSLTASFYYDQNSSRYAVSTSFPRNAFSTGIIIQYNLGN